jgi:hypothetical protein
VDDVVRAKSWATPYERAQVIEPLPWRGNPMATISSSSTPAATGMPERDVAPGRSSSASTRNAAARFEVPIRSTSIACVNGRQHLTAAPLMRRRTADVLSRALARGLDIASAEPFVDPVDLLDTVVETRSRA